MAKGFVFGTHTEFDDPVTFGDPVIVTAAKALEISIFKGAFYQAMGSPTVVLDEKEYDIYSRSKTIRDGVIGEAWLATGGTGLSISAEAAVGLTIGHVLKIDDEVVQVKSVSRVDNTVDVWGRGAGGTTAAAHAEGAAFMVIGYAGSDPDLKYAEPVKESTSLYRNYMQTVFEPIEWEKHGELRRKGLSSANATEVLIREAEVRVAEMLSRMAIHGVKQKAMEGGNRSMSAGLLAQLSDSNGGQRPILKYNGNGKLSEDIVVAALREVFKHGGADTIWCNYAQKDIINKFNMANSALVVATQRTDHTAGTHINQIDFEGKLIDVRIDVDIPNGKLPIVTQSKCQKGWLKDDALTMKDEPRKSSRETRKTIQGSVGYIIEDVGSDHILVEGITV